MTEEEAVQIAEYVAAACPAQRFNEFTPDVWGEILKPYAVAEARTAVIAVARRQRWISPAEIVDEIKARREERIELAHVVYDGDPSETGAQSAVSRRALVRAAADGQLPPRTPSVALGTVDRLALPPGEPGPYTNRIAAARAAVSQAVPTAREGIVNPRAISCRICQALPGASCEVRGRRMRDVHPGRLDDAKRRAAGLPPIDPVEEAREQERRLAASAHAVARATARQTPAFEDVT
ncbi:hypothetical protein [Streptomyces albipurpureus]|uniref:DNA-binding phage zinc finger domain-containing protein n=1 Tax=Streptomyces albipurpureus TaxID=2897419 RepID=A0ABT0V1N2_9ACTN|nr:hypothetical protein [Streptomyces sp. CWNU-1]MCM2394431.1 hypothetical protein [Streptomyces sp. CWNU-1]